MTTTKKTVKNMALHLGHHGVGATISALIKFIHPSEHICNKFPNPCPGQHLLDCKTIRQEVKTVTRKEQLMLIVHHEDFKIDNDTYIELYAVKEDFKIDNDTYIELYAVKGTGRSTMKAIRTTFLMHRLLLLKKKSMMNRGCS